MDTNGHTSKKRTLAQNASLHLYFEFLATELNNAGYDVLKTLRHDIEIPWNATLIKELIWRKVQLASYKKKSTSDLTSGELQLLCLLCFLFLIAYYLTHLRNLIPKNFTTHTAQPFFQSSGYFSDGSLWNNVYFLLNFLFIYVLLI